MHLYPKGAWVLHMVRTLLGDEAWWRALKHYLTKHRAATVLTHDLQRAIEEATGRSVDRLFDQFIYTGGHPEYEVWSAAGTTRSGTMLCGCMRCKGWERFVTSVGYQ